MPITITPQPPLNAIGPGLGLFLSSSFVGPLPEGSFWRVTVSTDAEGDNWIHREDIPWTLSSLTYQLQSTVPTFQTLQTYAVDNDTTVHVLAELHSPTSTEDSGAVSLPWNTTAGLGAQMESLAFWQQQVSGFTNSDRNVLYDGVTDILNGVTAQIQTATGTVQATLGELFTRQTLDRLTLQEITSGETFDPVSAGADSWYFGVIVRVTTIPDAYNRLATDSNWRYPDLAVLEVYRGADLEYRKGIHTPSWLAPAPWGYNLQIVNLLAFDTPPPETTINVKWALGCGGQVFLMAWP
jgi:hypothetical protein